MNSKIVEIDIKLRLVQTDIERLVKERNISTKEWNLRTERVERILGPLLEQRNELIKSLLTELSPQ